MMQTASMKRLSGIKIMVTRPKEQTQELSEQLRALGGTVIELPTIEILPPAELAPLDDAAQNLRNYDWVIFTSVHGVRSFLSRLKSLNIPIRNLGLTKVAAIGPVTTSALKSVAIEPKYVPSEYLSERIVQGLGNVRGKRILLPRADIASKVLPTLLRENGAIVAEVAAYRTVAPQELTLERVKELFADGIDLVTFTSPSTVRNLVQVVGKNELVQFLSKVKVACIGPVTVEAVRELGLDVKIISKEHTVNGLVEAIANEI
jgi:uroporphyrinogen III methyltransferase/synthase